MGAWIMADGADNQPCPNLARSVKVHGPLSKDTALHLASEIKSLREQSWEPITVSIRSGGGEVEAFHTLAKLFNANESAGGGAKIITVGHHARSAAAYLLVIGDCAYATKTATLHFHGVRSLDEKRLKTSTREKSLALAVWLDRENRKIAGMMAGKLYPRLAARHHQLRSKISRKKSRQPFAQLGRFVDQINGHLSSEKIRQLLYETFESVKRLLPLSPPLSAGKTANPKTRLAAREAALYQAIIAHELRDHPQEDWIIRQEVAAKMMMDYFLARDFLRHGGTPGLPQLRRKLESESSQWHLWCFSSALCHRLLAGEYSFEANDAYWLGLVDAIIEQ
jgi:hypothetical protein